MNHHESHKQARGLHPYRLTLSDQELRPSMFDLVLIRLFRRRSPGGVNLQTQKPVRRFLRAYPRTSYGSGEVGCRAGWADNEYYFPRISADRALRSIKELVEALKSTIIKFDEKR
jgi:hypothetical protein